MLDLTVLKTLGVLVAFPPTGRSVRCGSDVDASGALRGAIGGNDTPDISALIFVYQAKHRMIVSVASLESRMECIMVRVGW